MDGISIIDKLLLWWRVKRLLSLEALAQVLSEDELVAMRSELLVIAEALERMIVVLRAKVGESGRDMPADEKV